LRVGRWDLGLVTVITTMKGRTLVEAFTTTMEDDIKEWFRVEIKEKYEKTRFVVTLRHLAEVTVTHSALIPRTEGYAESSSDISASSDEDKSEMPLFYFSDLQSVALIELRPYVP
jgi:hypothetical protein